MLDVVAVCGVEKMTDATTGHITAALATAADADFEGAHGASFVALNALIMQRYMHEYDVPHDCFAPFSVNAHANAVNNPNAMFHKAISVETYRRSAIIADPINLYDSSPISDGSAAVILAPLDMAKDLTKNAPIRILASATATDSLDLAGRVNMLDLAAARLSARKAYEKSGLSPDDIDVFEVHDAFSIMAALSLEAAGFADPGKGVDLAQNGDITIQGRVPISTMGGLKGRGHPVGATGVYELVDLITQLRGDAGENQVSNATIGMTQNIGGTGATVVTHILSRD
jgi:acetyl-CoA C-acetyltransferase